MNLIIRAFILFSLSFSSLAMEIDLGREHFVPLYDCNIYSDSWDQKVCRKLSNATTKNTWESEGYAVECARFIGSKNRDCKRLSRELVHMDLLSCRDLSGQSKERCEVVVASYEQGYFGSNDQSSDCYNCSVQDDLENYDFDLSDSSSNGTKSDYEICFEDAYRQYQDEVTRVKERGRNKTIIGGLMTVGGLILDNASDSFGNDVMSGIVVGVGASLAIQGAVEWTAADRLVPHKMDQCRSHYERESRRVMVDGVRCMTHYYYSYSWGRPAYYYQTVCNNRSYYHFNSTPYYW